MTERGGDVPGPGNKGLDPEASDRSSPPTPQPLDELPRAFQDSDVMPWEQAIPKPSWPWGYDRGTPLESYPSAMLVKRREQMAELIRVIDEILTERAGE